MSKYSPSQSLRNPVNGNQSPGRSTRRGVTNIKKDFEWNHLPASINFVWPQKFKRICRGSLKKPAWLKYLFRNGNWLSWEIQEESWDNMWMNEVVLFEKTLMIELFQILLLLWMYDMYRIYCIPCFPHIKLYQRVCSKKIGIYRPCCSWRDVYSQFQMHVGKGITPSFCTQRIIQNKTRNSHNSMD